MNTTMTSPQCHALREDLKAFVDGELTLPRRLIARVHLSRCLLCQQEIREMKRIGREIRTQESSAHDAAALTPEFRARLLTHLNPLMPTSAVGASRPAPYWRQQPLLVFGSGAVAVAVFSVVFVPLFRETPGEEAAFVSSVASPPVQDSIVPIKIVKSAPTPKPNVARYTAQSAAAAESAAAANSAAAAKSAPAQQSPSIAVAGATAPSRLATAAAVAVEAGSSAPLVTQPRKDTSAASSAVFVAKKETPGVPVANKGNSLFGAVVPAKPIKVAKADDVKKSMPSPPEAGAKPEGVFYFGGTASEANRDSDFTKNTYRSRTSVVADAAAAALPARLRQKETHLGINVEQLPVASQKAEEIVKAVGGHVAANRLSADETGEEKAELIITVPSEQADALLVSLAKLGEVVAKNSALSERTEAVSVPMAAAATAAAAPVPLNGNANNERKQSEQGVSPRRFLLSGQETRHLQVPPTAKRARGGMPQRKNELSTITLSLRKKPKVAAPKP